jgi:hypothetical protein
MLNLCGIVAAILKMAIGRHFSMVLNWFLKSKNFYRSPFSKWPPQYLTNSALFDFNEISYMNTLHCDKFWAWFFAVLWRLFWKWRQVEILWCHESIQDIIIYLHMKFRWNRTMLNLWGIVVVIRICHNAKCSFKPVVSGRFGRLHHR